MDVVTPRVGVRDLKANLSAHLECVQRGGEVVVTDRGRPVARLVPIDRSSERLADLVGRGLVSAPNRPKRRAPEPVEEAGPLSDLVADQRR